MTKQRCDPSVRLTVCLSVPCRHIFVDFHILKIFICPLQLWAASSVDLVIFWLPVCLFLSLVITLCYDDAHNSTRVDFRAMVTIKLYYEAPCCMEVEPTGQQGRTATGSACNGNEGVAGTVSEAFVRWPHHPHVPSNCRRRGTYGFARDTLLPARRCASAVGGIVL